MGAKRALWYLTWSGLRIVNFVHDEFVFDIPMDQLKGAEQLAAKIMIEQMQVVIPDVKIGVESAAMLRWNKKAKELRDTDGGILVWVPPTEGEKKK
jgi:hypothetical protein